MNNDISLLDTSTMLRDAYEQVSWTPDTMLLVLSEYLDVHGDPEHLAYYLSERVREEGSIPLYDFPKAPLKKLGVLGLCPENSEQKDYVLEGGNDSLWITVEPAEIHLHRSEKGVLVEIYSRDCPSEEIIDSLFAAWDDMLPSGMAVVEVHASTTTKDLHELDLEVAGVYRIAVPGDLDASTSAGIALDVFHDSIPVRCLDDFSFKVVNDKGEALHEADNYEAYSGCEKGFLIRKK